MSLTRRGFLAATVGTAACTGASLLKSDQPASAKQERLAQRSRDDRVFICNEDSNTLSVINPFTNQVDATINLTSFDEDPRPPFRFVTGGTLPTRTRILKSFLQQGERGDGRRSKFDKPIELPGFLLEWGLG